MKNVLFLLFALISFTATNAQNPCGCEISPNDVTVCGEGDFGLILEFPNACIAACLGFQVLDNCDGIVIDTTWGGGDPIDSTWVSDCDCTIDPTEPYVCAQDASGAIFEFPNACFATCYGFEVLDNCDGIIIDTTWGGGDPIDSTWVSDCDCTIDPTEPYVCVQDASGAIFEFPNACFAACYGFEVLENCDGIIIDTTWVGDCGCTIDPTDVPVCAMGDFGQIIEFPNACFAACYGFEILESCDGVIDTIFIEPNPWVECECEIDPSEPFVCAQDEFGVACYVPNACYATCLGLTLVGEEACEITEIEYLDSTFVDCLTAIDFNDYTLFQQFLLALNASCNIGLSDCILNAPLFETDEAFLEYLTTTCEGTIGPDSLGGGSPSGLSFYNAFLVGSVTSKTSDISAKNQVSIVQNPTTDVLNYHINATTTGKATSKVLNLNGQIVAERTMEVSAGDNNFSIDLQGLPSGMYLLNVVSNEGAKTLKFLLN